MKRIITLLFVMVAVAVNAQSIKLFYGEIPMNNNDTVFLTPEGNGNSTNAFFGYKNLTNNDFDFIVKKEACFWGEGASFLFCIGECYSGNTSQPIYLGANEIVSSDDEFALHTIYTGPDEPALVKYTFYKDGDPSDAVSFYIGYSTAAGLRESDMVKVLHAFPNPAVSTVSIDFVAPDHGAFLVIKNLTGKEVYRTAVSNVGRKQISVSSFSPGVYLYGVEADGRMMCTKKLLIK